MKGDDMTDRRFNHYTAQVTAGPGRVDVNVFVVYFDDAEEVIGSYCEGMIAFATTWKDVAQVVDKGMAYLGLDVDPRAAVSPMVDLS